MAQEKADKTQVKSPKELAAEARAERLRQQLRENLHKRKGQARARKAAATDKGESK
jgi:hypothetical protein